MLPGVLFCSSSALAIAPFIPSFPGVSMISAPKAFNRFLRSTLIVSGIVNISLYPFTADTNANPTPVLPLVGSIITAPGCRLPVASAVSIIDNATLSLTLPAGLKYSNFPITRAGRLCLRLKLENSNNGVLPTKSVSCFAIFAIMLNFCLFFIVQRYGPL